MSESLPLFADFHFYCYSCGQWLYEDNAGFMLSGGWEVVDDGVIRPTRHHLKNRARDKERLVHEAPGPKREEIQKRLANNWYARRDDRKQSRAQRQAQLGDDEAGPPRVYPDPKVVVCPECGAHNRVFRSPLLTDDD